VLAEIFVQIPGREHKQESLACRGCHSAGRAIEHEAFNDLNWSVVPGIGLGGRAVRGIDCGQVGLVGLPET
jgi:hypothetical protein